MVLKFAVLIERIRWDAPVYVMLTTIKIAMTTAAMSTASNAGCRERARPSKH